VGGVKVCSAAVSNVPAAEHTFTPPTPGEALDWVLVLDDAAKGFPPPGSRPLENGSPVPRR
jgi:hypothetical protein